MVAAQNHNNYDDYSDGVTVRELLQRSYQNALAKEIKLTAPVVKGAIASFVLHSLVGGVLIGINPLLALVSLAPAAIGIKAATGSLRRFDEEYGESIENPAAWEEYVPPQLLEGSSELLETPVQAVIEAGRTARGGLGKRLPPAPGAKNSNLPPPPPTSKTGFTNYTTATGFTPPPPPVAPPTSGTEKSGLNAVNRDVLISMAPSWPDGEHLFMVGLSGGAKTTVLQSITAGITSPVVYLTIKTDDTAPPGWLSYRLDKFASGKLLRQLDWLISALEDWVRRGQTHRLIIDEYVSLKDAAETACKALDRNNPLKGVADRFEALIKVYIRAGRSDGHYLGLLSQTPNGTDNFKSAKTQQGLRVFLCASEKSSEKFRFFVPWAKQLFGDLLCPEAEETLKQINSGFWHLFADGGRLVLNRTSPPTTQTIPCQECPTYGIPQHGAEQPAEPAAEPATDTTDTAKQSVEERILRYLRGQDEGRTAREITAACTCSTDDPRPNVAQVRDMLALMISEGDVERHDDGTTERYRATGT